MLDNTISYCSSNSITKIPLVIIYIGRGFVMACKNEWTISACSCGISPKIGSGCSCNNVFNNSIGTIGVSGKKPYYKNSFCGVLVRYNTACSCSTITKIPLVGFAADGRRGIKSKQKFIAAILAKAKIAGRWQYSYVVI